MMTRWIATPALLLATATLWSARLDAQVCIGMPLEWGPRAVSGEVAQGKEVRVFRGRAAHDLGNQLSLAADYSHARFDRPPAYHGVPEAGSGNGVAGTLIYRLVQLEIPLCTFASVRYAGSSIRYTQQSEWDPVPMHVADEIAGTMASTGVGLGIELPLAGSVTFIPFATAQIGWSQMTHRYRCSPDCGDSEGPGEGYVHAEGQLGLLLQLGRAHLAGTYRLMPIESDPLLSHAWRASPSLSLLGIGFGVVF